MRTAVLTVSTSGRAPRGEDRSGPVLAGARRGAGCEVVAMEVVPDDFALIEDRLHHYVDEGCDVIFTTGGTGFTPDDITPEATRAVIHREAPGIAEAMRAESLAHTPMAVLSRAIAGIAESTLIVNFPGCPKAVEECFAVLEPVLATRCARCAASRAMATATSRPSSSRALGRAYGERVVLRDVSLLAAGGRDARRLRRQRRRQDDAAADPRHAAAPARGRRCACSARELPREAWAVRGRLGLLAHEPLLYRDLTARENLRFHARLHGVAPSRGRRAAGRGRAGRLRADEPVRTLSRGMAQRVAVCRARAARAGAAAARRAAREPRPGRRGGGRAAARRGPRARW